MKKVWEKPSLVILTRNKPEESVLSNCKYSGEAAGPQASWWNCQGTACGSVCADIGLS